ncbi:hypothetical protein [Clostridium sp.]|uniref:hypothetical protein n=1 Tax=Clostridium sp. TaxID=1506 RepID=UPI003216EE76
MKKKKTILITLGIIALVVMHIFYPKTGSFDKLVLSEFPKANINSIEISKGNGSIVNEYINCDNNDKLNEFIAYIGDLNIVEYVGRRSVSDLEGYSILLDGIYNEEGTSKSMSLKVTIYNHDVIQISNGDEEERYYKIYNEHGFDIGHAMAILGN